MKKHKKKKIIRGVEILFKKPDNNMSANIWHKHVT